MNKYYYLGNCMDLFDMDGKALSDKLPYRSVTQFAQRVEASEYITRKEFSDSISNSPIEDLEENLHLKEYLFDREYNILILYDKEVDIHFFFINQ